MLSNLLSGFRARQPVAPGTLVVGSRTVPLLLVRNPRARRYLLRVRPDGAARVTIPRGGSQSEALSFVERNRGWLEQQLERLHAQPRLPMSWLVGSTILFRGEMIPIEAGESGGIRVGTEHIKVSLAALGVPPANSGLPPAGIGNPTMNDANPDLRPTIERHFRALASVEFPPRVAELAARHQFTVQRVTVRNQKSRWGSCSRRGTISLNWRLIQTPPFVLDYLILHELAHLRHMDHSHRFWQEVERLCPEYSVAERWLKTNRQLLR